MVTMLLIFDLEYVFKIHQIDPPTAIYFSNPVRSKGGTPPSLVTLMCKSCTSDVLCLRLLIMW